MIGASAFGGAIRYMPCYPNVRPCSREMVSILLLWIIVGDVGLPVVPGWKTDLAAVCRSTAMRCLTNTVNV
jgi:hypothetical protein